MGRHGIDSVAVNSAALATVSVNEDNLRRELRNVRGRADKFCLRLKNEREKIF